MKKSIGILCAVLGVSLASSPAWAGDFDGSRPLLISVIRVIECVPDGTCQQVTPASIDLPQFLTIDFTKKTIRAVDADEKTPGSVIERQEFVDGKLILQGAEDGYEKVRDGLGWTMAIAEDSGQVVLTGAGEEVAFVVFGAALAQ